MSVSVRMICTLLLCVTLLGHVCLSALIDTPREEKDSEVQKGKRELDDSSNSSDSSESSDSSSNSSNSDTSSDSSSSEDSHGKHKKTKQKRSLDSIPDSLNKISEGQNQTKEVSSVEKNEEFVSDLDITYTSTTDSSDTSEELPSQPTLSETESTTTEITSTTDTATTELESERTENPGSSAEENTGDESTLTTEPSEESAPSNSEEDKDESFTDMAIARADKLSEQIKKILMHYRKEGVVVVPGQSFFPEPMIVEDFEKSFSVGIINFKNLKIYGLSNFTVEHINTDVDQMQVYILLHMKKLVVLGNYTLRTFWSRSGGPFNVTLMNVESEGVAAIETTSEGHLEASDSEMDMTTKEMLVDFKNLGSMLQSMVSSVGDALFDRIKPQILNRVNLVIRKDVNEKLKEFSVKFVNKVSPVDLAFSEGRRYVREHGYDPFNIEQHTFIVGGIVHINMSEFSVQGLSRFHRAGNLSLSMDAGVIQFGIHVLTQKLTGGFKWSGQAFGIARSGKTNFTIDQLQVRAVVNQSLDVTQKPQLEDLDLHLGWVKVTMDSPMTLNMMVEGIINAFPRLIKHMIVDSLERPLKEKIQEILNKINVESFVDSNLPRLDSFGL